MASTQGGFSAANQTGMPSQQPDAKNAYGLTRTDKNGPTAGLNGRIATLKNGPQ